MSRVLKVHHQFSKQTRAECVDTTDKVGEPLTACYCHVSIHPNPINIETHHFNFFLSHIKCFQGDLCNSSRHLTTTSWLLPVAIIVSSIHILK